LITNGVEHRISKNLTIDNEGHIWKISAYALIYEFIGKGHGSKILDFALRYLREIDTGIEYIGVSDSCPPRVGTSKTKNVGKAARFFMRKFGFVPEKIQPGMILVLSLKAWERDGKNWKISFH
jgi:GNAT superfamily N-acetyltransferase